MSRLSDLKAMVIGCPLGNHDDIYWALLDSCWGGWLPFSDNQLLENCGVEYCPVSPRTNSRRVEYKWDASIRCVQCE